ncbi:MAG TPA: alpha/beta fold hydrolase, partial [Anaerolineales bacterium]|nr:alpha/beta fold hydrolase [Anaerolineales bacterium]
MPEPRKLSVFLCHASQDKPIVRELYQRLIATDWIDPWLDEEKLSLGQHWTSTIEEAIDSADSVIIFLSQNSVQKEGFVQRELNRAWNRSLEKPQNVIFLIPFRLDDCEVPYNLRERHWGDYFGLKKEKTYESLLHSLKQRHEQKLLLERKEQARAEELTRIHKEEEDRIRRTREEEERARVQAQEARTRKVAEAKENSVVEDQQARKKQDKEELAPQRIAHSAFSRGGGGSGILLDGAVVHYETLGRGRPVIFLHSWIGSWRYWYSSMQVAARAFRSYGLDLWGFGDTAHSISNYSLEQQATLLDRFLTEMAIGKIALIGHGLGALVGMTFATRFPQSVDRLMAVSCPLDYRAVNARLRTASLAELAKWLSS